MSVFELAPSILSADFSKLGQEISSIEAGGATILHFDVMDGQFVPNITIGLPVLRSVRKITDLTIDAHLMIKDPGNYAVAFVKAGANMVSVHIEADHHIHRTLTAIREAGAKAGVAINPGTSLSSLVEVLPYADFILLMSVNPGFGGQKFIPTMFNKLKHLRQMIAESGYDVKIEIDGGVDLGNIAEIVDAGAEIVVAGSAVFGKGTPSESAKKMIDAAGVWV